MSKILSFNNFKLTENYKDCKNLIIVDVQRSFRKFFTEMYINLLQKHCNNFENVYVIWDNHHEGKNVDKDYLFHESPEIPISDELYTFPNTKSIIEKRYNYDVDVNFYKKILSKEIFQKVAELEENLKLKRGDIFPTTEGTAIIYIGNHHRWFHCPKKLYEVLITLKNQKIEIVGGSDSECFLDVMTTAESLGCNITPNHKFIWSANHCPIK
jgi:hypothetical protein